MKKQIKFHSSENMVSVYSNSMGIKESKAAGNALTDSVLFQSEKMTFYFRTVERGLLLLYH